MVQETNREVHVSLGARLRRLFRRPRIVEAPLDFTVTLNEQGKQVIDAYITLEGQRTRVTDIEKLWKYGTYLEEGGIRYVLDKPSLNALLAIRFTNPQISGDGSIVSDIYPTVLNHLRKTGKTREDSASQRITIQEAQLEHIAKITYDPATGITVEAGYATPNNNNIIAQREIVASPDNEYMRYADGFYRAAEENIATKKWVETGKAAIGLDEVPEFFKRDLVILKSNFGVVLSDQAEKIKVVDEKFQPSFNLSLDERGWLNFSLDYKAGDYKLPDNLLKEAKVSYVRPDPYTWIKVDRKIVDETKKQLTALDAEQTETGYRMPVARFLSLEDAIEHIGGDREVSAEYQHFLDEITGFKFNPEFKLPPQDEADLAAAGVTLRPYQRSGIQWVNWLATHHMHGVLADDMGLGKTIEAISAIRLAYEATGAKTHSLVVCPKSVIGHWSREIRRIYPEIGVYEYAGQRRDGSLFKGGEPAIFVTTYEVMSRDLDIISEVPFFFVVLDEGTRIKNPEAKRSVAAKTLNAAHRLVLSGTPIENRPAELWSIFDFLMKGHLGTYGGFISTFERPIRGDDSEAAEKLAKRIKPFILRRLKTEVAKDLPEKIDMDYWCELTPEQKALYGQIQASYVEPLRDALQRGEAINYTASVLPVITKLKQVCDHPSLVNGVREPLEGRSEKFDLATEIVAEILERGEAVVLFSHFLGTLDLFEAHAKTSGINYIRIDGSTRNRQELIDAFNQGKAQLALCSLTATAYGINLTAASHVIHVDRWWNPALEDQATDRVHRIGQSRTVYVHKILTEGTLEERIDMLLAEKRGMSDRVIGAATKGVEGWTREQLLEILQPLEG